MNVLKVGQDSIVQHPCVNNNASTTEIVLCPISVRVKKVGRDPTVPCHCALKIVITVENVLLQIHANVINGKIDGEMAEQREAFLCSKPRLVTHK